MARTIILLSAKRCGSTAAFHMFQRHPDVGICHVDRAIANWEPGFWTLAWDAIRGDPGPFVERLALSLPFLKLPPALTEDAVFDLWDAVLAHQGPIVFDKSPQYLGNRRALELISKYKARGNDVRLFAFIRDPRDAIASQFELWGHIMPGDSPKRREAAWLAKYEHLEELRRSDDIPLFRYEDFASEPRRHAPLIYRFCGLRDFPPSYAHVRPTSIHRYSTSRNPQIRAWRIGRAMRAHLLKHGYRIPQIGRLQTALRVFSGGPTLGLRRLAGLIKRLAAGVAIGFSMAAF